MIRLRWFGCLAAIFSGIQLCTAVGFGGIVGDYCATRTPTCCQSRNDDCTVPILGNHLCYCDFFCDRGARGNDCCPDFKYVCRNETVDDQSSIIINRIDSLKSDNNAAQSNEPTYEIVAEDDVSSFKESLKYHHINSGCEANGRFYEEGESLTTNCNRCICDKDRWSCESEICLIQSSVLQQLKDGDYTWTAKNYSEFWGKTLHQGIQYRLGTLFPEKSARNMNEIIMKPRILPNYFDARERWPYYIHPIRNQGDCGSSWAFSTTATSADRLAIMSNGRLNTVLSPQQMLSCSQQKKNGCQGGHLDKAWWYMRKVGVVSEDCYKYKSGYTSKPGKCSIPHSVLFTDDTLECPSGVDDTNNTLYRMTPAYRISNKEEDIMSEIMTNGPVQATFLVYGDFFMYHRGVYQHLAGNTMYSYAPKGYHSVRLLGWGTETMRNGAEVKYWLAANSWGTNWGEDGYFRIIRGQNHCEIESFIIGAWGRRERRMKKIRKKHKGRKHFRGVFH